MRAARIIGEGMSYYHGISRVIERAFVLSDDEKERFRILLRKTASFSGITVLTHSILDNHIHTVLEVPEGEPVAEEETYRVKGRCPHAVPFKRCERHSESGPLLARWSCPWGA